MNKNILLSFIALFLFACNNANDSGQTAAVNTEQADEHSHVEEAHAGGLSLNKGSKWQSDESTWVHAANLNALVDGFNKKENADMDSYQVFAANMQEELEGLVKDCKMKGPDHEALHLWLEPIMKDVNDLKKAGTAEEAKHIAEKLSASVEVFDQFFENAH